MAPLPSVDVSIVIVSFNSGDCLRRCLSSIFRHTKEVTFEVIVVDNASGDGTARTVGAEFPQVRLIANDSNTGYAAGANRGIAAAQGEAILLLNPDTEFAGDVLLPMFDYLSLHPEIGILGPKLLNSDGSLQLSCRSFPNFSTALFNRYSLATRLVPKNRFSQRYLMTDFDHTAVAEVDWLSGACMMLPREVFDSIGLFDEGYFMYIEDVDLCQRAHRAGYKVVYFPITSVVHHIGRSSSAIPGRSIVERHKSMWHYYKKYMRRNAALDIAAAAAIGVRCGGQLAANALRARSRDSG